MLPSVSAVLVKDINPLPGGLPNEITPIGSVAFFTVDDGTHGRELWRSDGTAAGTALVLDINPGSASSYPARLTNVNGTLYFIAGTSDAGPELWKSDGTAAGTVQVKDIESGPRGSAPGNLTNVNGTLFFNADDGVNGRELWKSDGTEAGTVLVKDITPGSDYVNYGGPRELTDVNGTLFFTVNTSHYSFELWKSDGTEAGTVLVKAFSPGYYDDHAPRYLTNVNGTLFFIADDGTGSGRELWKSDGTDEGTVLVKDINPGRYQSSLRALTAVNGTLFFSADDGTDGRELWKSDGTEAGTTLVLDIRPGSDSSNAFDLAAVNGTLYFSADDGVHGQELWKSDGTAGGTILVKDINPDGSGFTSGSLANVNGTLFFSGTDNVIGTELWKTDGTADGTVLVKNITPGAGGSYPHMLTNVDGTLFFIAVDGEHGLDVWTSDGTAAGTQLVKDITPGGAASSYPQYLTDVNGTVYFNANNLVYGQELWKSDGTEAGTALVKDIRPGRYGSFPGALTNVNGTLFFVAFDPASGGGLWKSDGTAGGTALVKDMFIAGSLTNFNGTLFFSANDNVSGIELWKSDGTEAGTVLVKDINPGSGSSYVNNITDVNGELFFAAFDSVNGLELWKSDGTEAGTVLVKDINPGSGHSSARSLTNVNGELFFVANDGAHGFELWKSDGTEAGTVLVKDINPGSGSSYPGYLENVNGTLFFFADDGVHGFELWKSDGTEAGTVLVKDIDPDSVHYPLYPAVVNGTLFFTTDDGVHGLELWKSDGTTDGTVMVKDIRPGNYGSRPSQKTQAGGRVFFTADPGDGTGVELWVSDGTAEGTVLVKDIDPTRFSYANNLASVGDTLFFTVNDGVHGDELWKVTSPIPIEPPEFISEILVDPSGSDAPNQYVEIHGTPDQTIADGTYLLAIEGDGSGEVQDIFDLSGLAFGSSGYLVVLQAGNSYSVAAGTTVLTGTTTGFGGLPDNRFSADAGTDLPGGSESYLLIQAPTAPALTDDIDANDDGTPDGAAYDGWTVLDSIGILDGDAGDHSYAALTFRKGTDGIATGTVATVGFAAGYVGRNGDSTGSTETDWVAGADLQGTAPNFFLNNTDNPPSTDPVSYAGKPLDSLGGPNFVNVAPVNTVPDAQTTNEDTPLIFSAMIGNALAVADVDAGTAPVKTQLTVTNGTLTLAGTANLIVSGNGSADVTITGSLAAINAALDGLRFDPTRDFNGTATLQIATNDQGNTGSDGAKTDTDTVSITMVPVNDAPSFTLLGNVTINEDAGAQTVAGFARNISAGPPNESGQHLTFSVVAHITSGTLTFTSGPAIDPTTGDLTFTTAADSNGTATVDVTLKDDGGTDRGGVDTSPTRSFTLTVRAVNDAPLFDLAGNVTADEDAGPQTLANFATNFRPGPSTATDEASQTLVRYDIAVLSTTGGLTFASGPAVDSNGTLTFQTTANAFGTATVQVTAVDSGPGTSPNVNSASKTFTLTVNPVNDAPDFTLSGDVTVNEDAGPQRIRNFARNISAGAANESGQHLTFSVTAHVTSGTLTFTSGPAIDPTTGDLTFTTSADSNGTATLDVTLKDDGGTDRGGIDTSPTRSFTLTVRAVNDAPLFDLAGNVTADEDAGPKTVTNFATNFRPGPATATDEAGQTLVRYNVAVLSTTGGLTFASGPAVDSNGTLKFQSNANAFGTATVQVTAVDSGPGTSPNVNSASKTFTLTVNPVNDAPDFTLSGDVTVNEDAGAQTVAGFALNISAGPGNESGQHLTFSVAVHVTSGALGFTSGPAIDPTTGDLSFTTAADSNGTATLDVTLKDDGGTAGGGVDTSPTRSFTLTVRAVNDAPLFDLPGNVTVNEDAGPKTVTNFATNFRPGPATATDEAGQTLVRYDTVVLSTTGPLSFTAAPTVSADGTLTFTAAPNAFGTAKVRGAAIDSGPGTPPDVNTGTRTFTVRVNPVNDPPTANNDTFVVTQGGSKLLDVLSNDTSAPDSGETLTIVSASQGSAGGTVAIDGGTALRYTPHKSGGSETFSYTIADGYGGIATATVTVNVVPPPPGASVLVTGTDAGAPPHVIVRDALTGAIRLSFLAYVPTFQGGVRVATGDLTGDGIPDIITGTGPGTAPHVKVFDGRTGVELFGFLPYGSAFTGGVFVAAGDVNGDGIADLITGTDAGVAAQVEVFSGRTLQLLGILLPYGAFPGGARVAAGDVNGDGFADVITGAGPGAGPDVRVFDGRTGAITAAFMAFGLAYPGGVYVAAGDLDGDGFADIITGAGTVAHVNVFSGRTGVDMASFLTPDVSSGAGLVTTPAPGTSGVRVAVADIDGDGLADLLTGAEGAVQGFKGTTLQELDNFFAYGSGLFGGLFLGGS